MIDNLRKEGKVHYEGITNYKNRDRKRIVLNEG